MKTRILAPLLPLVILAGCVEGFNPPDRAPDALGNAVRVETSEGVTSVLFEHDAGYEYFSKAPPLSSTTSWTSAAK